MVDEVIPFDDIGGSLYIRFKDMEDYREKEEKLMSEIRFSEGRDRVIVYLDKEKKQKVLPPSRNVRADDELINKLSEVFGEGNVKFSVT